MGESNCFVFLFCEPASRTQAKNSLEISSTDLLHKEDDNGLIYFWYRCKTSYLWGEYDYIFLDSRTGFTEIGDILFSKEIDLKVLVSLIIHKI